MSSGPFNHSNLAPEINKAIQASDEAGGVWLKDVKGELRVQTRNTMYEIKENPRESAQWLIRGHAKFCPNWSECSIHGSTFGGSMLKMGFIGRGMYMEYSLVGEAKQKLGLPWSAVVTTSQIRDVYEVDEEGKRVQ
mgnify:CR=1 FL=1